LGSELTRRYGSEGLPDGTISLHFRGSSGQSFGAFLPKGITLALTGDSNDYTGKGLSGGRIIVRAPEQAPFVPEETTIIGNVALYGATSGEAYIGGVAGERFCVRNSGAIAVAEAVGDHGCEYMTGGRAVILGPTGRNFAAGMSGGIAYVYDEDGTFESRCNKEMVQLFQIDAESEAELKEMIENHLRYTGSRKARLLLRDWDAAVKKFVCVLPNDYRRMMQAIRKAHQEGFTGEEALMHAFEANYRDLARVSGN
jgi:glutamate synthase (ferredoxin)